MKMADIYTGAPVNIKTSIFHDFSAISLWIFMQQKQAEVLLKDLSNDV